MPANSADRSSPGSLNQSLAPRTSPSAPSHLNDPPLQSCPGLVRPVQYVQSIDDSEESLGGPVPVRSPPRCAYSIVSF